MQINKFSKHIFWPFQEGADLPEAVIIRQVLSYGEVADLLTLNEIMPPAKVKEVILKWKDKDRYRKRINFFNKVIADDEPGD
ncbi:MAG: hypothetical protein RBR35_00975 [Salinivirgaceae bacterium]|jgi:hypothetical protein|nr:hypothetical protein [Salinivirgaceae bacterium]